MDWKGIVRNIAPTIGAALGGPVAGIATKFIADKFLGDPNATEEQVSSAILGATTEQLIKLKELENQFKAQMKQLDIDVYKLETQDRDSARNRQTQLHDWTPTLLAVFLTILFIYCIVDGNITQAKQDMINQIYTFVIAYYFGSSVGSRIKDIFNKN